MDSKKGIGGCRNIRLHFNSQSLSDLSKGQLILSRSKSREKGENKRGRVRVKGNYLYLKRFPRTFRGQGFPKVKGKKI